MLIVLFPGIGTHCVSCAGEMAGSTSNNMEVDLSSQHTPDDDISVRARKYLAEKRGHLHVGNGGEGGSVSVSSRSSTSSAIFKAKSHSLKAPNLNGQEALSAKNYGSFYNPGDYRIEKCNISSSFEKSLNASYSFDPASMKCSQCLNGPHEVIRSPDGGVDADIFVLTDQNFPPSLPTATGRCMAIVRVENGSLAEIASVFLDAVDGCAVGVGTVILLASASHLGSVGLAGYAEDLVRASKLIMTALSSRVTVRAGPLVLLGGTDDPALIRAMAEMVGWITNLKDTGEGFPGDTLKAALLVARNHGEGGVQPSPLIKIRLPVSLLSYEKKTWESGGWDDLPTRTGPMDMDTEKFLIESFIGELNNSFPLNLDPKPIMDRECTGSSPKKLQVVLVGMSHARNLAEALEGMGATVALLKINSCRPTPEAISKAAVELAAAISGMADAIVVFQFLDNAAYYARTEDGCLMPAQRDKEGVYHLVGDMVVAPKEMFLHSLKISLPLLKSAGSHQKVILSPLPRFLTASCCDGPGHVKNRDDTEFGEKLLDDLVVLKRQIKDFCHINHLGGISSLNTAVLMSGVEGGRKLAAEERQALEAIWGPDPVHPSQGGYQRLATNLMGRLQGVQLSGGCVPPAPKRNRWADDDRSVLVRLQQNPQGGSRGGQRGQWRRGWGRFRRH